jgi:hypothetical protein
MSTQSSSYWRVYSYTLLSQRAVSLGTCRQQEHLKWSMTIPLIYFTVHCKHTPSRLIQDQIISESATTPSVSQSEWLMTYQTSGSKGPKFPPPPMPLFNEGKLFLYNCHIWRDYLLCYTESSFGNIWSFCNNKQTNKQTKRLWPMDFWGPLFSFSDTSEHTIKMTITRGQKINVNHTHKPFEHVVIHQGPHHWTLKKTLTFLSVHPTS